MSAEYEVKQNGMIYRQIDSAWIPPDPRNNDFIEYQAWLAAGNTADVEQPLEEQARVDPMKVKIAEVLKDAGLITQDQADVISAPVTLDIEGGSP